MKFPRVIKDSVAVEWQPGEESAVIGVRPKFHTKDTWYTKSYDGIRR